VSTYGAAVSYIYASDRAFGNYGNGVFAGCMSKEINHAILVVGYGTEGGVDYWLVKNSWGPNWGKSGMIKIRRGTSECGIGGYCYAAQVPIFTTKKFLLIFLLLRTAKGPALPQVPWNG
jgi:hypothetical protein